MSKKLRADEIQNLRQAVNAVRGLHFGYETAQILLVVVKQNNAIIELLEKLVKQDDAEGIADILAMKEASK